MFFLARQVDLSLLQNAFNHPFYLQNEEDKVGVATLLDIFDGELRLSGRLLVQSHDALQLFDAGSGLVLQQPYHQEWRFVADLPDGSVKEALSDISALRALLPELSGTMRAIRSVVRDDDDKIHVRTSFYIFERHDQMLTLALTRPLQGYTTAHRQLLQAITEQGGEPLTGTSDVYAALGAEERIYQSKPEIILHPEAPIKETSCRIINTFLQVARDNEPGIKADYDTEFLHDYRVSLRKVRSALSLFKGVYTVSDTERLKQMFADIMKTTNRLRDLDVYLLDKTHYFSLLPESLHDGLRIMFAAFGEERQEQFAHVADMLESSAYAGTMRELTASFAASNALESGPSDNELTLPFACRLIWKRYKKVCKTARRITTETPDKDVHRLRIQCKKLRYLLEFFTPLFPRKAIKQLIKALKRLQDNLGRFNDYVVQQHSLQVFLHEYAQHHAESLKLAESIGALVVVLHQCQMEERRQVMENFAGFDSETTRAAFTALFTQEAES
jgi:CHAD domain-containing protein